MNTSWNRRQILKGIGLSALSSGAASLSPLGARNAQAAQGKEPRFLIVIGATGGASIIDSLLAIRESECTNAATINCFPDALVQNISGSPFRAVDQSGPGIGAIPLPFTANQSRFVSKHQSDLMVATLTGTSVNHAVAQKRAITGNEAWSGRTLQEVAAAEYGAGFPIPNVNMAAGTAFIEPGTDRSLPSFALAEPVVSAASWPLALDGMKGLRAPSRAVMERAREMRDGFLDPRSRFMRVFGKSPGLEHWIANRKAQGPLEAADLISKLMLFSDSAEYPLAEHGLSSSPDALRVREKLPELESDPLAAQAALAFLLLKHRVSVTVTIGPGFNAILDPEVSLGFESTCGGGGGGPRDAGGGSGQGQTLPPNLLTNPPLAFDFSHQGHRQTQAVMWDRLFRVADGLIDLLRSEEYAAGESYWDRSLIYIATDFGRSKTRPAGATTFGSGHDLNNGVVLLSPRVNGNKVLGGVDPSTGLTHGFDPQSGEPDRGRTTSEAQIFGGILQALDVDTTPSGLPDVRAMRKTA